MNNLRNHTSDATKLKGENTELLERLESLQIDSESLLKENERLSDELDRQQTLYHELKKMRGRGEEMDLLQEMEKVNHPNFCHDLSNHIKFVIGFFTQEYIILSMSYRKLVHAT